MMEYVDILAAQPAPVEALAANLAGAAAREGIVDAVYRWVPTPIGEVFIAAGLKGIVRLAFSHEQDPAAQVARDVGPRVIPAPAAGPAGARDVRGPVRLLDQATRELAEYFAGERRDFTVPVDLHLGGFRGEVVRLLPAIGYGRRASYKELAARAGNPGAVRAVGSACANNPIPVILPCHRVVRSDGSWGNYRGGPGAKTLLLALERAS